jgi:hypothetical protein
MADMSQYYDALKNADAAGDHQAAEKIANYIHSQEQSAGSSPAKTEEPSRGVRGTAEFAVGNILQGIQSGAEAAGKGMPGLETPLKVVQDIRAKQGKPPAEAPKVPSLMDVAKSADPKLADQLQPRTPSEKYAAAALQALPSAVGGEGGLAGRAVTAAAAGVGAQAGQDVGGTAGAVVGGLAGGLIGGSVAGAFKKQPAAPLSQAAQQSERSGISLSIGEETGSKPIKQAEKVLGNVMVGPGYKDKMSQAMSGVASVSKIADQMATSPDTAEQLGTKLQTSLKTAVSNIEQLRNTHAAADYGAVKQLAQNRPVITYDKTVAALDKIINETKDIPSGESRKIFNQATDMRDQLTLNGQARTYGVDAAMQTRRTWGAAARGTGNVFTDVDPNLSRQFAARLFGAINDDFTAASSANTPIAQALAKANKTYANYSRSIDQVRKSSLASLVGEDTVDAAFSGHVASTKAPEKMAQSFMNLQPSQARTVTGILQKHAPQVLQDTKAYVLRDMLQKSAGDTTRGELPMSFPKFLQQYKKMEPKLREMGFTTKELADIKDVTDTMSRASDRVGTNPSGTAQALQVGAAITHPHVVIPAYIAAKALLTPEGRILLKRAYSGSKTASYQASRALMATYVENRAQSDQQEQR